MPLQRGIAFLVQKAECRIIPAYIHGAYDAWPRGRKFPKLFGKMAVVFGPPIEWKEGKEGKAEQEALAHRLEKAIRDLKTWYITRAKGLK